MIKSIFDIMRKKNETYENSIISMCNNEDFNKKFMVLCNKKNEFIHCLEELLDDSAENKRFIDYAHSEITQLIFHWKKEYQDKYMRGCLNNEP